MGRIVQLRRPGWYCPGATRINHKFGRSKLGGDGVLMDIYVLAPIRTAVMVERFLAWFLPHRERADADYTVRLGIDEPAPVLGTPEELAAFCESRPDADARAYWNSRSVGDPHSAHVFFLPDGGLVFGLSVAVRDEAAWDQWLEELQSFAGAKHQYWIGECPPEDSVAEFIAVAHKHAKSGAAADGGA
jgi:hypothetical protein